MNNAQTPIKICDTLTQSSERCFIIKQAPENVRNDNKQRENKTLHVKVRGGDQGGGGDDPRLGEPAGQKVHQRMLNGTAQDDLLQSASE